MSTAKKVRNAETAPMWRTVPEKQRDSIFRSIEYMVRWGFKAWYIAERVGCTTSQVYQACAKLRIHISDYREGKNEEARGIIQGVQPIKAKFRKVGG